MKRILILVGIILAAFPVIAQNHFTVAYTGNPPAFMSIYVYEAKIGGVTLNAGDEIAVFDGTICCGVKKLETDFSNVIAIPAAKADGINTGYTQGNNISIKYWDASESKEHNALVEFRNNSPYNKFTDNESAYINTLVKLPVTIQLTAEDKIYDGTNVATVAFQITSGSVSGDVNIDVSDGVFDNKNAGSDKTVTGDINVTGTDAENFDFTFIETATASISKKSLTVTGTKANNKTYDGTLNATLSGATLVGTIQGDNVTFGLSTGQFSQKNAGENIPVTATLQLSGSSAQNYTLVQPTGLSANITVRTITVDADSKSRECSGNDPVLTYTYSPALGSGDSFAGQLTREPGSSLGEYGILQGTLSLNSNYNLIFNGAIFKIEDKAPVWSTPINDLNRTLTYSDTAGIENAQKLFPIATDACDSDVTDIVKVQGKFVADAYCNITGTYTNKWTVIDNSGITSAEYVQVITIMDNDAPVFEPVTDYEVVVPAGKCETKVNYPELVAEDGCLDRIFLLSGKGAEAAFPVGVTNEKWVAVDRSGNSDTISFNITVISENENPAINTINDLTVINTVENIDLVISGIYGNGCSVQQLFVNAKAGNTQLVPFVNVIYCENNSKGILELKLLKGETGTSNITVTVTDDKGRKTEESFVLTVNKPNTAPYLVAPIEDKVVNASFEIKIPVSQKLGEYFDDADNDELTLTAYEAYKNGLPAWAKIDGDFLICDPILQDTGCIDIVIKATDPNGGTATDTFSVCVDGYPVGLRGMSNEKEGLKIYPNPTGGMLNIDFDYSIQEKIEISVVNMTGQEVVNKQFSTAPVILDLNDQQSGTYMVRVKNGSVIVNKNIIVSH